MKRQLVHCFEEIISTENLLDAWREFLLGKRGKPDVQEFSRHLLDNILELHSDLANGSYRHGGYTRFGIADPKPRTIHKAGVRDRLVHHAVYRVLYPFFDRTFIADSFSCRAGKGTHAALNRFRRCGMRVSRNNTQTCWVLQCDVRRFFDSIDHQILIGALCSRIADDRSIALLRDIIGSFSTAPGRGLPLGNLTSQLLVNIYLNEFDQFVKHLLKVGTYVRYADDFVLLSHDRQRLVELIPPIAHFLDQRLRLALHPRKVRIRTLASGVDFLGWVHFPTHRILRTTTKRRMLTRVRDHGTQETTQSFLGLLQHGSTFALRRELLNRAWLHQRDTFVHSYE